MKPVRHSSMTVMQDRWYRGRKVRHYQPACHCPWRSPTWHRYIEDAVKEYTEHVERVANRYEEQRLAARTLLDEEYNTGLDSWPEVEELFEAVREETDG